VDHRDQEVCKIQTKNVQQMNANRQETITARLFKLIKWGRVRS